MVLMLEIFDILSKLFPYFLQIKSLSIYVIVKEIIDVIKIRCECSVSVQLVDEVYILCWDKVSISILLCRQSEELFTSNQGSYTDIKQACTPPFLNEVYVNLNLRGGRWRIPESS